MLVPEAAAAAMGESTTECRLAKAERKSAAGERALLDTDAEALIAGVSAVCAPSSSSVPCVCMRSRERASGDEARDTLEPLHEEQEPSSLRSSCPSSAVLLCRASPGLKPRSHHCAAEGLAEAAVCAAPLAAALAELRLRRPRCRGASVVVSTPTPEVGVW